MGGVHIGINRKYWYVVGKYFSDLNIEVCGFINKYLKAVYWIKYRYTDHIIVSEKEFKSTI